MKKHIKNFYLVYLYLFIMAILEIVFWTNINDCGLGFGILTYYILFPLSITIISIIYGHKIKNNKKYLLTIFFGISVMLFQHSTYSLANMLAFDKINIPHISMILLYGFISLIGIVIGNCLKSK